MTRERTIIYSAVGVLTVVALVITWANWSAIAFQLGVQSSF